MSKKEELAARATRLSNRTPKARQAAADLPTDAAAAPDSAVAPAAPAAPAATRPAPRAAARAVPRAKPVRVSADLAPQDYRALLAYCATMAEELGRAKVAHVLVIRALVAELNENPALQEAIRKAVITQMSD